MGGDKDGAAAPDKDPERGESPLPLTAFRVSYRLRTDEPNSLLFCPFP